ncbi:DNA helicase, partial [Cellulomonas bogoriensis 69B4 = DSM 16987]
LVRCAGLGAFTAATRSSPWHGAEILTAERARRARATVTRLLDEVLPEVRDEVRRVAESTGLTPAATAAQWGEQLQMLAGVRGALDVFQPIVFERSAADLVAATATAQWRAERGIDMPGSVRRRLRKQAKDVLRPGRPVEDLHAALVEVQAQREIWQAHCPAGGWPRIPEGLAAVERGHASLLADLTSLDEVLVTTTGGAGLADATWDELVERLARLRQDEDALDTLPERTALLRNLDNQGLGDLLEDLQARRVPSNLVGPELELAWWTTVFEEILRADPALAGYDGNALARLVEEFRTLDRRYVADRALLALAAAREDLRTRLRAAEDQTQALFADVVEHRFTGLRQAVERYPAVTRHLRPCLVASAMLVPHVLPPGRGEDLVILDAAGHMGTETVVSAVSRGRQVLVVGDVRCASGTALPALAEVLPSVGLNAESRRDPRLTSFLARYGYGDRLAEIPLPQAQSLLRLDVVDGSGMPAAHGLVESTQAEVDHVVELVLEHALTRPEESLAVVTVAPAHADRVREAVLTEVRANPALERFFRTDRPEPFTVVDLAGVQGLTREAVVLSVGYGRTPHGRVLHRFGDVSEPGGEALLLEGLGAGRRRLTVVSCFAADQLDPARLRAPGAQMLADLLTVAAEEPGERVDDAPGGRQPQPDRLVLDLAEQLWRHGLLVEVGHGTGHHRIPLVVGHPDLPREKLVAVLTDDEAYVAEPSVRVRDRQVAERLERLGWTVVQVWSAAAFLDPQGEADAILDATVQACQARLVARQRRSISQGVPTRVTLPASVDDPDDEEPAPQEVPSQRRAAPSAGEAAVVTQVPRQRGPRPPVEAGLPVAAYSDDQLDDLVAWIASDGVERDIDELASRLREELGLTRRGTRVDAVVLGAVTRYAPAARRA